MSNNIEQNKKLYKCYKDTCNRCINEEFITDYEYQELLGSDGKIVCPEGHDECGIKEISEDEYPKAPSSNPPIVKFAIIGLVVIALVAAAIYIFSGGEDKTSDEASITEQEKPLKEIVNEPVNTDAESTIPDGTQTLTFDDGSKYVGEVEDGKMNGLGTFYYESKTRISKRDLKKRYAEKGDYLSGEFKDGKVITGKLYDSENNLKEVIIIGR